MEKKISSVKIGRAILGAFLAALVMKFFLFDFMLTEGQSMMPAIKPGTILLISKVGYGFRFPWSDTYFLWWARPKEGDVVVFYTPMGEIAVKRCAKITEKNEFVALGDNSRQSYDSRSYGPIPLDHIIGKVVGIK
ncbi:MAG: signal peptidase I [Treponema sp.]|jgi:signal peptidase I|nr:signal peptidase I [Treponema sp.]